MILDKRIENGFWVAASHKHGIGGMALLSRDYPSHGNLILTFAGKADVEEYFVRWGFYDKDTYTAVNITSPSEIERISTMAGMFDIGGFVVNPPLDNRPPKDFITPIEMRDWARQKED